MNRNLWIILAVVGAVAAAAAVLAFRPVDRLAPDFALESLAHGRFYLHDQRGKVVVLLFWDPMCVPCKHEMSFLAELQRDLGGADLALAAVCIDPESPDQARRVAEELGVAYPVLLDDGGRVADAWSAAVVPTTVIIDADGKEVWRRQGYDPAVRWAIRSQVERLLAAAEDRP